MFIFTLRPQVTYAPDEPQKTPKILKLSPMLVWRYIAHIVNLKSRPCYLLCGICGILLVCMACMGHWITNYFNFFTHRHKKNGTGSGISSVLAICDLITLWESMWHRALLLHLVYLQVYVPSNTKQRAFATHLNMNEISSNVASFLKVSDRLVMACPGGLRWVQKDCTKQWNAKYWCLIMYLKYSKFEK